MPIAARGAFVTGTGTGIGKTVVAAAICAALASRGERVAAYKPVITGLDEDSGEWPRDHELLASVTSADQSPEQVCPHTFGPAVSPHLAAELAGVALDPRELVAGARRAAAGADAVVVEGVGGLLVPLSDGYLIRDLAADLGLGVVVAAPPGLGTINHTLLTLASARAAGLDVRGVVMTPWPPSPSRIELSNRRTVERLGEVRVEGLQPTSPDRIAAAGAMLPLDELVP
jgi:dethiobiotin synthetase